VARSVRATGAASAFAAAGTAQAVPAMRRDPLMDRPGPTAMSVTAGWERVVDLRAIVLDNALAEIERELRRRLDPVERVAIAFALERFADRWPRPEW